MMSQIPAFRQLCFGEKIRTGKHTVVVISDDWQEGQGSSQVRVAYPLGKEEFVIRASIQAPKKPQYCDVAELLTHANPSIRSIMKELLKDDDEWPKNHYF